MKEGIKNIAKLMKVNLIFNKSMKSFFQLKMIFLILYITNTEEKLRNIIIFSQEINLIIKGSGNQSLLNNSFYPQPSQVYVNGIYKDLCKVFCELESEENNVTLLFNDNFESCERMFAESENLLEIDLSNFIFSNITSMVFMFSNCVNLKNINFGKINTSSVNNMKGLFYKCQNLKSLNLSNFDTSLVSTMEGMFYNCTGLLSIDISNINTSNVKTLRFYFINVLKLNL